MTQPPNTTRISTLSRFGLWLGPLFAVVIHAIPTTHLSPAARDTAAIGALMAVYWITEAIPLAATSLIPLFAFPVLGILSVKAAAAPYASPTIYLFLGGFMLAMAVERWGLHRRLALGVLSKVGTRPPNLVAGFMAVTAFLSMWINNTATTVMMIPISASVVALMRSRLDESKSEAVNIFETSLLLAIAFGASIGGLGTLVGTAPNAVLASFLAERGIEIGFGRWMIFAVPLVVVLLLAAWLVLTKWSLRVEVDEVPGGRELVKAELDKLGPLSRSEWTVLVIFLLTALLWIVREPLSNWEWLVEQAPWTGRLTDPSIAIAGALALFVIPVDSETGEAALDWPTANRLPWGVLVLLGGGLSLASAVQAAELDIAFGTLLGGLSGLPPFVLVLTVTVIVIFLTEITSNTATAAALIPVLFGLGERTAGGPLPLLVPATLAASCAFMLPVATPPNAIVFGTGRVSIDRMVRGGIWLNVIASVVIPVAMYTIGQWVFDYSTN